MEKRQFSKILTIVQWGIIGLLIAACVVICVVNKKTNEKLIDAQEIITEDKYMKIYNSERLSELKKENRALYDSVRSLRNAESAIEIRYKYIFKTDTIRVVEFKQFKDSVYVYKKIGDTVSTYVTIKAKDLSWCKIEGEINSKFQVITQEQNGQVISTINHDTSMVITGVDAWHAKYKWYDGFFIGPSVGVGYGPINNKFDVFFGLSIGYDLMSIKKR